jgi:hypothetical protein
VIGQSSQAEEVAQMRFCFCITVGFVPDSLKLHIGVLGKTRHICTEGFSQPARLWALPGRMIWQTCKTLPFRPQRKVYKIACPSTVEELVSSFRKDVLLEQGLSEKPTAQMVDELAVGKNSHFGNPNKSTLGGNIGGSQGKRTQSSSS